MFLEDIERASKVFKGLIKEKKVKVFSHLDADGLTSASIIVRALVREGVNFELRIEKQLTEKSVEEIEASENDVLLFCDFGSGQLDILKKFLEKTQVIVLDHHEPLNVQHMNLFHINPLAVGEEEVSSSVICYLFAKNLNIKNTDLIDLAIIGAIADEQDEKWELGGLSKKIMEEAELLGKITMTKGLRMYGRNTRPLHKALEYTSELTIPGITGSESNAIQFLSEIGIKTKEHGEWRKLKDLTIEEQQKLASSIIIERLRGKHVDAHDIFGEVYTIIGRPEELQDVREFATLINACGRTGNYSLAIRICLGDLRALVESAKVLENYRKSISNGMNFVRDNMETAIIKKENCVCIVGENKIPDTMIGTITSMILNSDTLNSDKPLFGFADTEDNKIKISARIPKTVKNLNLRDVMVKATKAVGGESGGHQYAAGGLIKKEKLKEFIDETNKILGEMIGSKEG